MIAAERVFGSETMYCHVQVTNSNTAVTSGSIMCGWTVNLVSVFVGKFVKVGKSGNGEWTFAADIKVCVLRRTSFSCLLFL